MVAPPLLEGALKTTATEALPRVPMTPVGAPGVVAGVTDEEAAEAALLPTALVAMTLNV
jgi:hypothetical protein